MFSAFFWQTLPAMGFLISILLFGSMKLDHPQKYVCKYKRNVQKELGKVTVSKSELANGTAHIRHQCRKTAVLSCHRYLFNSGVEKMNNI